MKRLREHRLTLVSVLLGVGLGVALLLSPVGKSTARASYDWATIFGGSTGASGVAVVHVDEHSLAELGATDGRLDRRVYARALDRLGALGAGTVVFDILFLGRSEDPLADEELAAAIHRHGRVVLAGGIQETVESGVRRTILVPPEEGFRRAGATWGVAVIVPDGDGVVRRFVPTIEDRPSLALAALAGEAKVEEAVLRYHGRAGSLPSYSLARLLEPDGVPAGALEGATVFIGGRAAAGTGPDEARDTFATPYSRWGNDPVSPGVDLHAEAFLTLRDGSRIHRVPGGVDGLVVVLVGVALGFAAAHWSPGRVLLPAAFAMGALALFGIQLQSAAGSWFNWLLPAGIQIPLVVAGGAGIRYDVARRERQRLKRAFGAYLSPHMAEEIARRRFDVKPGGREVEATILFTDLEDFTGLSESLPPEDLGSLLTGYFNRATRSILGHDGTIIKYVGDAVMASWGAPLADERQADRAVAAALELQEAVAGELAGHRLSTRVGIHSGPVLAGNLGSDFRFDYTCIGFTTNIANRLESLNKQLGTQVLISGVTVGRLRDPVPVRDLGDFRLSGSRSATRVCEPMAADAVGSEWLAAFEDGLAAWRNGDDASAVACFERADSLRKGGDGPSSFYLSRIRADIAEEMDGKRIMPLDGK